MAARKSAAAARRAPARRRGRLAPGAQARGLDAAEVAASLDDPALAPLTALVRAAGVIHGDFERGFIRAETISYDDYVACGGEVGARDAGKMRLEGKDYVVGDGDVMHFRFGT